MKPERHVIINGNKLYRVKIADLQNENRAENQLPEETELFGKASQLRIGY